MDLTVFETIEDVYWAGFREGVVITGVGMAVICAIVIVLILWKTSDHGDKTEWKTRE